MSSNTKYPASGNSAMSLAQGTALNCDPTTAVTQPLLTPQQVTTMVSLPQNLCFTTQPTQTSLGGSAGQQHNAINVTLGFPMAAAALNAGALSQQFIQSLSVGQQPTICASLPQGLSFPLNQTLFTVPVTSAGQFLSTFNQFTGLPSLIMGGQQSIIPGSLMTTSPMSAATAQLQTLGTLGGQSLAFPISTGPVVTEIASDQQQHSFQQIHQQQQIHHNHLQHMLQSQQSQEMHQQNRHFQPEQGALHKKQTTSASQIVPVEAEIAARDVPETVVNEVLESASSSKAQDVADTAKMPEVATLKVSKISAAEVPEIAAVDVMKVAAAEVLEAAPAEVTKAAVADVPEAGISKVREQVSKQDDIVNEDVKDSSSESIEAVKETQFGDDDLKAEEKETDVLGSTFMPAITFSAGETIAATESYPMKDYSNSTIVEDKDSELKDERDINMDKKQELVEEEIEEDEEMPLPDSTPTGDEMDIEQTYDYSLRHSPSPMASLQLTRADTTTTTTASSRKIAFMSSEDLEMKLLGLTNVSEYDEAEFIWEDYLQETGASAVPPTAFKHVECSLQSGFVKGMKLEVANKSVPGTFWVASVVMTCGPLLRLRYEGYDEDGSADFWSDLSTCELHPIGWCAENGQSLQAPEALKEKHEDWKQVLKECLKGAKTAPSYLLDNTTGTTPIDQLKQGMRLEVQDCEKPTQVWLARIIENVGGRLYLRIEGMDSGSADFWAFYLSENVHPIGWAKQMGYTYQAPQVLTKQGLSEEAIRQILKSALKEADEQNLPADIFKDQLEITEHTFRVGMKLEAVNPRSRNHICPATVVEVIDKHYFMVEIDDLQETDPTKRVRFCCHRQTPTIFPIQWTVYKGIKLTMPSGWTRPDFNWNEYLTQCQAFPAPENCFDMHTGDHEFARGMKLEAANPDSPNQICAATITKIVDHLMWVHLDSSTRIVASHVEHIGSHNLFPVGWCESNGYQLRPPRKIGLKPGIPSAHKRVAVVQPEVTDGKEEDSEGRTYCPKIFFNHKCFSGPYLSKGRIAELPRSIGPGPLQLVMKEVLTMLISVAYKSCRVLREIQLDGPPNPSMYQQILKAKYKSKSYRAVVEICRTTNQLEDFCRQVCIKLECCPNLISPHFVGDNCPETCSQLTKTKYTYYYGKKKKKIGRPPGGHTNLENGPKRSTKRRKRRRFGPLVPRKVHHTHDDEEDDRVDEDKMSVGSDTRTIDSSSTGASRDNDANPDTTVKGPKRLKRKYTHHIPPPSEIRTRGAKLPRYSFERRTHKKILLSHPSQGLSSLRNKTLQIMSPKLNCAPSPEATAPRTRATTPLPLTKNPLQWTVSDTIEFIQTTDCGHVAKLFKEQEIDGQALLLLTLPAVQEHLELKLGPAIKLCHQIERVKRAFYEQFASESSR